MIGPARVIAHERVEREAEDGWIIRHEVYRQISFGDDLRVHEVMKKLECDPKSDPERCETTENRTDEQVLAWDHGNFVTNHPSAWKEFPTQ